MKLSDDSIDRMFECFIFKVKVQLQSIPLHIIIPITLVVLGFSLVAYDTFYRHRRSQQRKQKDDEEDNWKYFLSNVP